MTSAALKHATLTLDDGSTLAYTLRAAPTSGAAKLVLIHSLALDRSIWDGVAGATRGGGRHADLRLPRPRPLRSPRDDLHGRTVRQRSRRSCSTTLDGRTATVAGCSMGGCVALAFAGLFPQRTSALGLIDTTAWYGAEGRGEFQGAGRRRTRQGNGGAVRFSVDALVLRRVSRAASRGPETHARRVRGDRHRVLRRDLPVARQRSIRVRTSANFRMPVAIVVGEEDYATPVDMARELHAAIPQSTLTILPKARHLTPIEHP